MRKAFYCLSLLLLPAITPSRVHALPRRPQITFAPRVAEQPPYLSVNGAPPLRFMAAPAPVKHVALAPVSAETPDGTVTTALPTSTPAASNSVTSPALTEALTRGEAAANKEPAPPAKPAAPILPDDARPIVRPEDFLPYFQIPGSARNAGDVTLFVPAVPTAPAASPLPASSATYTQSPK